MTIPQIDNITKVIKEIVQQEIQKMSRIDIYAVVDVNNAKQTVDIKHAIQTTIQFNDVPVASIGLGNFKGLVSLPQPDDFVIVAFPDSKSPVVLGSIISQFDTPLLLKTGESIWVPREKGAHIFFDKNDNIQISNKAKNANITIKNDGTITITGGTVTVNSANVNLGGPAGAAVARSGDAVEVFDPLSGTLVGTITAGSSKVNSE